jgi:hypothetical protein
MRKALGGRGADPMRRTGHESNLLNLARHLPAPDAIRAEPHGRPAA